MTIPSTFRSETALAAAVDAAFAEALAQELEAALAEEPAPLRPFDLPDTDTLIVQSGIVTGPCPPDPHLPSPTAQIAKHTAQTGGRLALRAAWWLLRHTTLLTTAVVVGILRLGWHIIANPKTPQALPQPAPVTPSEFLEATSRHITEHGWTQHVLEDDRGAMCIRGAERALIRSGTGTRRTARQANTHFRHVTGAVAIPAWNDWLARREDQIHAALLAAAARARTAGE
ncbi:DUF6197 family protein [Streptomyces malaysiensis]|uniref:DUF6197 family protein n=1 Tax=Streptomyces malaysiensis TaxID=92644 RepID=UPI00085368B3|nr:hypothetical protein [Streptomyces sp. SPMA113]